MNFFRLSSSPNNGRVLLLVSLFVLMIGSGCLLDVTGVNQAEAELAAIPVVTSVPTKERPSPTPVPDQPRADIIEIVTAVAVNRANSDPTATPTPVPPVTGSTSAPETIYPLLDDGTGFREISGGLWYTSSKPADEALEFYIDRMTYFRWDNYDLGEVGEGHGEVQFEKNFERVQINIWENPGLGHTSIVIFEIEPVLELVRDLPTTSYGNRWVVIDKPLLEEGEEAEEAEEEETSSEFPVMYDTDLPLPQVSIFYVVRMLDAGWQLIPSERLDTYANDLQFFREDDQIAILLQDTGIGTTVTLVE